MRQILKIHQKLISKEISAKELTERYLCAIKRDNPQLNAYVSLTADDALKAADITDRKIAGGETIDVLSGIPMTLKDNISAKGTDTTCCSKILEGYKPIFDATAWQRLKVRNAVLLGKTNMDEFAMGCSTETSVYGVAKNPYNTDHVSGGSSGGSAAAVSSNLAVFALGSDTGGSVRQPAGFCGAVGLKPTYGAVSRYGLIAYASSFDQIGVIAGSVEDTALVFDRISGFDTMDSTTRIDYVSTTFGNLGNDIKGKRIGVVRELLDKSSSDVKVSALKALTVFEREGAEVEYINMPSFAAALPAYYILACAEASSNLGRYDGIRYANRAESYDNIHMMICKTRSRLFGDEVKKRIMLGTFVLSEGYYDQYYKKAQSLRARLIKEFNKAFESFDALVTPVTPETAFKIGEASENRIGSFNADLCTCPVNLAGLPAVALPCGKDKQGLPIGLQIIGKKFDEKQILNLAYKYEQARGEDFMTEWGVGFEI